MQRRLQLTNLEPYLFSSLAQTIRSFAQQHPSANLLSLAIGDTTEPLGDEVTNAFIQEAHRLHSRTTYQGYPEFQGHLELRTVIASQYPEISPEEIFISDGAKSDYARLQYLIPQKSTVGIQDPCYPVFLDLARMQGHRIQLFPLEDLFFSLDLIADVDLFILCSPNNPLGIAYTYEQLEAVVHQCIAHQTLLIVDAAYNQFIQQPHRPRSIYEIPGADTIAIEMHSLSKPCGFTGIRLGWSIVPKKLLYTDHTPLHTDWKRIYSTTFNGASHLSQAGALAALTTGVPTTQATIHHYLENASLLRAALPPSRVIGGVDIPFLWWDVRPLSSWDAFIHLLEQEHLVTTPGVGFGPSGEGYLRISAFGSRENIEEGCRRLQRYTTV